MIFRAYYSCAGATRENDPPAKEVTLDAPNLRDALRQVLQSEPPSPGHDRMLIEPLDENACS